MNCFVHLCVICSRALAFLREQWFMRFLNSFLLTFPRTMPLFLVLPKQLSSSSSFSVDFRSVSINIYSQPLVSIVYLFMQIFLVKPRPMAVSKLTLVQSRTGAMGLRDQYQSTYRHQWRIQNFPQGVRQLPKLILFFKLLTKTAWKWKNLDPRGEGARPWRLPSWINQ